VERGDKRGVLVIVLPFITTRVRLRTQKSENET